MNQEAFDYMQRQDKKHNLSYHRETMQCCILHGNVITHGCHVAVNYVGVIIHSLS